MIRKIKGTFDIMPEEMPVWRYIEEKARTVAAKYGFEEIRTPTFESTELFRRGVGDTTDVVQKEMFTFTDRGDEGRSITLRPEGTASVARALIEHGKCSDAMPLKLFYIISCFRCEAPQAGRSREFVQFGAEMYGTETPAADATIIALADAFIKELGIKDIELQINSIGCPECRPKYRQALIEYFSAHEDELCDTCKERLKTNPLRLLDCKSPICKKIAEGAPKTLDYLCDDCAEHQRELEKLLDIMGVEYKVNTSIVRGLDYYTRTVFEFVSKGIGAQSTVCGGGRYDGLIEQLGGPKLAGIGFGAGITRLIMAMKSSGVEINAEHKPKVYIAPLGVKATEKALEIVQNLRKDGIYAECDLVGRSLKAQMKYADKIKAEYTLIIGDNEIETGRAQLREMATSSQKEIDINNIALELK